MEVDDRDAGYLWDIREAVRDCIGFVNDATYERFSSDKMMHSAVERRLEILAEAASRVSEKFQADHPEISWKELKGLRVVLAHRYPNTGRKNERTINEITRKRPEKSSSYFV